MRRALVDELPAFSHAFGIAPWDIDRMTLREIDRYRTWLRNQQQHESQR